MKKGTTRSRRYDDDNGRDEANVDDEEGVYKEMEEDYDEENASMTRNKGQQ